MYYFDYGSIDYGNINYRPITLFATADLTVNSFANINITANARITCHVNTAGFASLTCSAINKKQAKTTMAANGYLSTSGHKRLFEESAIQSSSDIEANTILKQNISVDMPARAVINIEAKQRLTLQTNIETTTEISIKALDKNYTKVSINIDSKLNVGVFVFLLGQCTISANGDINLNGTKKVFEESQIKATATVSADTAIRYQAQVVIEGRGELSGDTTMLITETVTPITGYASLICNATKTIMAGLTDAPATFFTLGNRCYMLNGTEFIWTDGENAGHVVDVAYVPLLTLGGSKDSAGTINEPLNYLSDSWWDSYSPDGTATTYQLTFGNLTDEPVVVEIDTATGTETHDEGGIFTVDRTAGTVTFSTPPAEGTNTLRIKGTKAGMMDKGLVLNCTLAVIYGGNNDTRVFVSGNKDNPNLRLQSGLLDPTYFPEQNFDEIGSDAEPITGFGKVADVLFTYKERSRYYTYVEGPDEAGFVSFPTLPVNDEYGCVAPRTIKPAQDGLLALSAEGVTWSSPSTVRGQFNTKVISRNINGENGNGVGILDYTKGDLETAHAIIYDEKYMLHIKDKVWVLDLKYTDLEGGIYCWYPWNGVPGQADVFIEIDNELYIGGNGAIYKESTRYLDDGEAITCYWTSPLMFLGLREWIKKFERLNITFKGQPSGNHQISFITDQGTEDLLLITEEAGSFDYASIDYASFGYGVQLYPSSQSEKIGYKGEYMQWQIKNDKSDEGLTILAQSLQYSLRKKVK